MEQLREMHEQLEELAEQKSQFCKPVAELQSHMSTVCSKRDATRMMETTTSFGWQKGQRLSLVQEVAHMCMSVELARSVYIS